ncbi:MAG: anaerobic ribonucleoside-triphosphate reductase activating protein [Candidatus Omnitrophota bacterium]
MRIAGLQKLSLVDYPGCLAAVVFVQGCNFRCGYCQNPDLVTLEKEFDCSEQEVLDYISRRRDMIDGVVITGGEPVIYTDLPGFIKRIKDTGIKVKLDTNGTAPGQLRELLASGLLDYVALDIKTSLPKYVQLTDMDDIEGTISESVRQIMASDIPYEFRTTCVPGIVDEKDIAEIGSLVDGAKRYCLQQFRPLITLDEKFEKVKPYTRKELERFRDILLGFTEKVEIRGV